MSGFVGIVNLDGKPVDRDLLRKLTQSMAYRGPDAQDVWVQGNVGFGHTMLRTTSEAVREQQPCTLDGQFWITADCRVDAREDLLPELEARGRRVAKDATDPELILHAYAAWGTDCVSHIIGDFAFAIWDVTNQRLFCARDHIGVKLFYYACRDNCLVFGNTVNSLRLHPAVSNRLNELAIADFLVLGANQDPVATSFQDIRRLLPAHSLVWRNGEPRIERYWTLPIDPPVRFRRYDDYVEHFLMLFRTVLRDRLRTNRVGIFMSGGLDASGIAAVAKELTAERPELEITAHTNVYDRLVPDRERHYTTLAAKFLRMPVRFYVRDEDEFYEAFRDNQVFPLPDPAFVPDFGPALSGSLMHGLAQEGRVALYGEGPDNALHYEPGSYLRHELRQRHLFNLLKGAALFPILFRQMPFWTRLSRSARRGAQASGDSALPPWLNRDFVDRLNLRERFAGLGPAHHSDGPVHPVRPLSYASLLSPLWQMQFERFDAGVTRFAVEVRFPYMDIRMLRFLLAVPAVPWCRSKYLLRRALRTYLPSEVTARPKTGLAGFPAFERWKEIGLPLGLPTNLAARYVDLDILEAAPIDSPDSLGFKTLVYMLGFFLRGIADACDNHDSFDLPGGNK
jgi:asparagine synthase (glutamine-hydrolysing)